MDVESPGGRGIDYLLACFTFACLSFLSWVVVAGGCCGAVYEMKRHGFCFGHTYQLCYVLCAICFGMWNDW